MQYFRVRNFEKFQHYKERHPPWIKLYKTIWTDPDFYRCSTQLRLYLIGTLTLASETNNKIPFDAGWIKARLCMRKPPDLNALIATRFVEMIPENASILSAPCQQDVPLETETETEKRKRKRKRKRRGSRRCPQDFVLDREWARKERPELDIEDQAVLFMDHEFRRPYTDWAAVWRNWIRRANGGKPAQQAKMLVGQPPMKARGPKGWTPAEWQAFEREHGKEKADKLREESGL